MGVFKYITVFTIISLGYISCIPLSIAPDLEGGEVLLAKKFKRKLPKRHAFIFTDPKNEDEFYHFINTKYNLNHQYVNNNVPIEIADETYYVSFYESEKATKILNLLGPFVNEVLENNGISPLFNEMEKLRERVSDIFP